MCVLQYRGRVEGATRAGRRPIKRGAVLVSREREKMYVRLFFSSDAYLEFVVGQDGQAYFFGKQVADRKGIVGQAQYWRKRTPFRLQDVVPAAFMKRWLFDRKSFVVTLSVLMRELPELKSFFEQVRFASDVTEHYAFLRPETTFIDKSRLLELRPVQSGEFAWTDIASCLAVAALGNYVELVVPPSSQSVETRTLFFEGRLPETIELRNEKGEIKRYVAAL